MQGSDVYVVATLNRFHSRNNRSWHYTFGDIYKHNYVPGGTESEMAVHGCVVGHTARIRCQAAYMVTEQVPKDAKVFRLTVSNGLSCVTQSLLARD